MNSITYYMKDTNKIENRRLKSILESHCVEVYGVNDAKNYEEFYEKVIEIISAKITSNN